MIIVKPLSSINAERDALRHKLMRELIANEVICHDIVRMGPVAFGAFCGKLKATGLLKDFRRAKVEEQVAKFLHILGQNFKNRALEFFFHQSGEIISRHFHNVLRAVVALEAEFLNQPTGVDVPPQILNNNRFYLYFKMKIFAEVDRELLHAEADHHVSISALATDAYYRIGVMLREQIASEM
ncbi:hypothetical protein GH714_012067 [Hevea brasiliensis]|uniref:DUF8040 domain-containing protein n=1 Tax=Hevea brasiliensis TaxID=3981 RepID=A0A6A6K804_HEVBR|nr:hypothetical protein GH714_012067 [Hevea brasiliensis]